MIFYRKNKRERIRRAETGRHLRIPTRENLVYAAEDIEFIYARMEKPNARSAENEAAKGKIR